MRKKLLIINYYSYNYMYECNEEINIQTDQHKFLLQQKYTNEYENINAIFQVDLPNSDTVVIHWL